MMPRALVLLLAAPLIVSAQDPHAHGHGAGPAGFEWAGIFETPEDSYVWTAQKVSGSYADAHMKMAVLEATNTLEATLHGLESEGTHSLNMTCTEVEVGGIIPTEDDACSELHFDGTPWNYHSQFQINTTGVAHVAIFTQHVPTEFESDTHYLRDDHGDDIEPLHTIPEAAAVATDDDKPWGKVIGVCILVLLMTLSGIVFMIPVFKKAQETNPGAFEAVMSSFAAGAILACAFFLILMESTHYVASSNGGWTDETDATWRWGSIVLAGYFSPYILDTLLAIVVKEGSEVKKDVDVEVDPETNEKVGGTTGGVGWERVVFGVLVGDFMHNFVDGIFIAVAFDSCNDSKGWAVATATIAHELAQELGDYVVLTNSGGLSPLKALSCNFVSGLSILFGAIAVLSQDIDSGDKGLILAFGGGTYLAIGASECMPRVYAQARGAMVRLACILAFIVGAIAIGLVLLDHEHCSVGPVETTGAHAGHSH